MTAVYPPPSPTPRPQPAVDTTDRDPNTVVGPRGTRYLDCATVSGVDRCIRFLQGQLVAHAKYPKRCSDHWQDIDSLLDRRRLLELEAWITPSDLPL